MDTGSRGTQGGGVRNPHARAAVLDGAQGKASRPGCRRRRPAAAPRRVDAPHIGLQEVEAIALVRRLWGRLDEAGRELFIFALKHARTVQISRTEAGFRVTLPPVDRTGDARERAAARLDAHGGDLLVLRASACQPVKTTRSDRPGREFRTCPGIQVPPTDGKSGYLHWYHRGMGEIRLRLSEGDRAILVEALEALIPEDWFERDDDVDRWRQAHLLRQRLLHPRPGGVVRMLPRRRPPA